jgi:hypothetical protein
MMPTSFSRYIRKEKAVDSRSAALNQLFDGANLGKLLRGVPLNHLAGQRFRVGAAVLFGGRLNFPCK